MTSEACPRRIGRLKYTRTLDLENLKLLPLDLVMDRSLYVVWHCLLLSQLLVPVVAIFVLEVGLHIYFYLNLQI